MRTVTDEFPFSSYLGDTTKEYLKAYFKKFKSYKTQLSYCQEINEFADFLEKDITKATAGDCRRYILKLESRRNSGHIVSSTLAKKKWQLSGVFSAMCAQYARELLSLPEEFENYFLDIQTDYPPDTMKYEKVPTLDELDLLHRFLLANDPMTDAAFLLAFKGFLTMEEFRNLSVSDLYEGTDGTMVVRVSDRSYPPVDRYNRIPDDVKKILVAYFDTLPNTGAEPPKLFAKKNGVVYTAQWLWNKLRDACDACGIKRYTFNDFRNAAVVYASSYHADVNLIANSMGYKTTKHIGRLESLQVTVNDAANLVGISFKSTHPAADAGTKDKQQLEDKTDES